MDEQGYILRRRAMPATELRTLLEGSVLQGWSGQPDRLWRLGTNAVWELGAEGRATLDGAEVRWRQTGATYDVLYLARQLRPLPGFAPLDATTWQIHTVTCRPAGSSDSSMDLPATVFCTADGSAQFVAYLDRVVARSAV
jgi:hypothetical protein